MILIAHRAPAGQAGCLALAAVGVSVFEIDVQIVDGQATVSHFLPTSRAWPRLRRDRWSFTVRTRARAERDLGSVAGVLPPNGELLLDLKPAGGLGDELVELVASSGLDPARCHACCKDWALLPAMRRHGFRTWATVADRDALRAALDPTTADHMSRNHAVTVRHTLLDQQVVADLHAVCPRIVAWTVNDVRRAQALAAIGVDGITADRPEVFRGFSSSP